MSHSAQLRYRLVCYGLKTVHNSHLDEHRRQDIVIAKIYFL